MEYRVSRTWRVNMTDKSMWNNSVKVRGTLQEIQRQTGLDADWPDTSPSEISSQVNNSSNNINADKSLVDSLALTNLSRYNQTIIQKMKRQLYGLSLTENLPVCIDGMMFSNKSYIDKWQHSQAANLLQASWSRNILTTDPITQRQKFR